MDKQHEHNDGTQISTKVTFTNPIVERVMSRVQALAHLRLVYGGVDGVDHCGYCGGLLHSIQLDTPYARPSCSHCTAAHNDVVYGSLRLQRLSPPIPGTMGSRVAAPNVRQPHHVHEREAVHELMARRALVPLGQ